MRTSGVPISFTANLRISLSARGALLLKELRWMLMVYSRVTTSLMAERPFFFSPFLGAICTQTTPFHTLYTYNNSYYPSVLECATLGHREYELNHACIIVYSTCAHIFHTLVHFQVHYKYTITH
uniref:Uncharacterized protein n=1 Tax=Cyprinus carpio TaxID=7962 RepID=A0A8C2JGG1_CYPCA